MAKKIIAVVPLWDDEKESIWMLPGYMNGIKEAGAIPIIMPIASTSEDALEVFEKCDGLLMTGGHDVSPSLYKEQRGVNSYHHQAVKELGMDLQVMAESEDGLIEAVRHTGKKFVWAFQWHPEFDFHVNPNSRKIFSAFINAC